MKTYETMTDEHLIASLREGESEIMDFLMEKYKHMVRKKAKAMFILGGENDDLIQEGMIGLFKAIQDYKVEEGASFSSFADLCVSRQLYSAVTASRRKKHQPLNSYVSISNGAEEINLDLIEGMQDQKADPEAVILSKEYQEQFEEALQARLSDLESRVYYLHMRGIDYQTIGKLLGKSPKVIDNTLQRIKIKAKDIIKGIS